jgi:hypothetical protein
MLTAIRRLSSSDRDYKILRPCSFAHDDVIDYQLAVSPRRARRSLRLANATRKCHSEPRGASDRSLTAVLDNWDPRVVDGFAAEHQVITFDNRGIGASSGRPAASIEQMVAERAEAFDFMVCAHTACTDPAERQIVLRDAHA